MREKAIIAKWAGELPVNTDEIRDLVEVAGHEVVGERTQVRAEATPFDLESGLVSDVAELAAERNAGLVVWDNELSPKEDHDLRERLGVVDVLDRHRLILDIFEAGAGTKEARLQVRLAELKYELPRICSAIRRDEATEHGIWDEEGKPIEDRKRQIDEIRRKLDNLATPDRHERRHEAGFDLVALAGYTNAGKTTLLRRLADDLSLEDSKHDDLSETAAIDDHLFETLGTTTRRATIEGRRALATDTVGFVRDLPHALVAAFRATIDVVYRADVVVLVVDASDPVEHLRKKVRTAREELMNAESPVVPVLNKIDLVDHGLAEREAVVEDLGTPIGVSAVEGTNLGRLRRRVRAELPEERVEVTLPNCGETMQFVSWAYDRTAVEDVTYADEEVTVAFAGRPEVVAKARAKADDIGQLQVG